jgi:hypothetical protein
MRKNISLTPENTITVTTVFDEQSSELDFEMYDDALGHDNVEKAYDENGIQTIYRKGGMYHDSYPIKIDDLKRIISKAEKAGANYIAIDYNCDHPDYTFFGLDIHAATHTELAEHNNQQRKQEETRLENLRKKKEELEKEIDQLTYKPNQE